MDEEVSFRRCSVTGCYRKATYSTAGMCKSHYEVRYRKTNHAVTNRAALAAWKAAGCRICGEEDTDVIEAHHVDPSEKLFTISGGARNRSPFVFAAELSKCVPLCCNCHRRVELGVVALPEEE